jgi:hypothetical protein
MRIDSFVLNGIFAFEKEKGIINVVWYSLLM